MTTHTHTRLPTQAVVCGVPTTDFGDGYRCAPDAIANPDNVVMVADDTVWINEDSSQQ